MTNYNSSTEIENLLQSEGYNKSVASISANLVVSTATARSIAMIALQMRISEQIFSYLIDEFPHVINYHLLTLAGGEKLHREDEQGDWPYRFGSYFGTCAHGMSMRDQGGCHVYKTGFREFFHEVLYNLIREKLEILLFNIQALSEQIGIDDFRALFKLIQQLNEDGVKELLDFSWHCKGHRLGEAVDKRNATTIISFRAKNIPESLQLAIANQTGFPVNLQKANTALEKILLINFDNRVKILNSLTAKQLKLIPGIAETLQLKAVHAKLTPGGTSKLQTFRVHLLYNEFPSEYAQQFYRTRFLMTEYMPGNLLDLFVSEGLLNRTRSLPNLLCQAQLNCFGILTQEHNIQEYNNAMTMLAQDKPVPNYHFRTLAGREAPAFLSELSTPAVAIGLGMAIGVGIYVAKSMCRQLTFFGKCFKRNRQSNTQTNLPAAVTTHYQPVKLA